MSAMPLHDRLLVRRIEEAGTVNRENLMNRTAKRKPWKGEVLAVGQGQDADNRTRVALDVKVGDKVLFGKHSGTIRISGEDLLILPEDEFLVVLT